MCCMCNVSRGRSTRGDFIHHLSGYGSFGIITFGWTASWARDEGTRKYKLGVLSWDARGAETFDRAPRGSGIEIANLAAAELCRSP